MLLLPPHPNRRKGVKSNRGDESDAEAVKEETSSLT